MAYFLYIYVDNNTRNMVTYYEGCAGFFIICAYLYTEYAGVSK